MRQRAARGFLLAKIGRFRTCCFTAFRTPPAGVAGEIVSADGTMAGHDPRPVEPPEDRHGDGKKRGEWNEEIASSNPFEEQPDA